jgi:hypothetical protein
MVESDCSWSITAADGQTCGYNKAPERPNQPQRGPAAEGHRQRPGLLRCSGWPTKWCFGSVDCCHIAGSHTPTSRWCATGRRWRQRWRCWQQCRQRDAPTHTAAAAAARRVLRQAARCASGSQTAVLRAAALVPAAAGTHVYRLLCGPGSAAYVWFSCDPSQ